MRSCAHRHILTDEPLHKLLGVKRFAAFGIQKLLKKHILTGSGGGGGDLADTGGEEIGDDDGNGP
jgi:hypothetical protein